VEEALAQPCAVQTDVIVLLIDRTLVDGVARAVEPLHSVSKAKVIVVMDSAGDEEVVRLAWAGVAGIFLTSGPAALLIKCICKVADGECWFDQNMVQAIIHRVAALSVKNAAEGSDQSLTKRELQVLRLVLDGLSNKEIAGRMELRETSVKSILQGLFQKNGVRSRSQLVRVALERRLAAGKAEGD
jgi:two-component system nitrate/nitrite response regulator NarL